MKKFFLSLFCIFFVPVTVLVFRAFDPLDPAPHFNPRFWICCLIYLSIILYCFSFLLKNRPSVKSIILSLLVGGITLGYGLSLNYLPQNLFSILAGMATALCFLQIVSPAWHTESFFVWKQQGRKINFMIVSSITLSCLALFLISHGWTFGFSFSGFAAALAAGTSEELIFRVFLPTLIYTRLKINAAFGNRFWVFLIISIPFSLIHLNYYDALDPAKAINCVLSGSLFAACFTFLINRFGIIYGVYAHFLWDLLSINQIVG